MKEKVMKGLERFSKSMVQPVMYVGIAGMVMVIGVLLTNTTVTGFLPFLKWWPIQLLGNLIYQCLMAIINNLGLLFVVGLSAAFAKREKHSAAIIGLLSYLMFLTANNICLNTFNMLVTPTQIGFYGTGQAEVMGIQVLDMGVFSGIIFGCIVGYVFNKTSHIQIKNAMFQIFSGARFSFFIMMIVSVFLGWGAIWVWPLIQHAISFATSIISETGNFGFFLFGFLERFLIPTGLHHLVYTPFLYTEAGGVLEMGGQVFSGAYAVTMAEIANPAVSFSDSIYYMAMGFTKMFGYVGIGLAFIHTAYKQNKTKTKALIIPLIITAAIASVTEPLDFLFIFISPLLFLLHSMLAGAFIVILKLFHVTGMSGGLINSIIMNVALGVEKTNYPMFFLIGVVQIIVYFFIFTFVIKKFDLHTPGRELAIENSVSLPDVSDEIKPAKTNSSDIDPEIIVAGLGGKENINEIENCFTRLRVNVYDIAKVDEQKLNQFQNSGIVRKNNDIQIIYGLQVPSICKAIEQYLGIEK